MDLIRELRKKKKKKTTIELGSYGDLNCDWCVLKGRGGGNGNRKNRDYPEQCIVTNSLNTEKSPEKLRKLAIPQTSMKDHELTLV